MERYETPGVEVITPLEVTLMAAAMAMLEAGIWTWSAEQGLRRDPSCLQLLGLAGNELDDLGWLDRVHPDDGPRLGEAIDACREGRSSGLRLEYRILHHQGHYIRLEERVRRDEGGQLLGVVRHLDAAMAHIDQFGSQHTEVICTADQAICPQAATYATATASVMNSPMASVTMISTMVVPRCRCFRFATGNRLSGGERQRVGLARALLSPASLWLIDEPLSALDPMRARMAMTALVGLARERKITLVATLHQVDMALSHFDRIIGLLNGQIVFDLPSAQVTPERLAHLYDQHEHELSQANLPAELEQDLVAPVPAVMHCR